MYVRKVFLLTVWLAVIQLGHVLNQASVELLVVKESIPATFIK